MKGRMQKRNTGGLTLKVGVEANSEDINTVCRPAGRRNGDSFEIDHLWEYLTKLGKHTCCFSIEEVHFMKIVPLSRAQWCSYPGSVS
jgi:hypothetical protein